MYEAFEIIKRDLGPDAVIISSKKVNAGGFWGIFLPKKLEVTAAVDEQPKHQEQKKEASNASVENIKKEIADLRDLVKNALIDKNSPESPPASDNWVTYLTNLEIEPNLAQMLITDVKLKHGKQVFENADAFKKAILSEVAYSLTPFCDNQFKSKIIAFIGPTGVGKTTTLAKLAAQFALLEGKKVSVITIDTFRIGAVEQLKTYGEIIGIPVEIIISPKELKQAVEKFADQDYILIDTAGRSSKNTMQIAELRGFLEVVQPLETLLVLSSTTKNKDLFRIVEDFKSINFSKIIFTKTDETDSLGQILNITQMAKIPVAYITNGQNVPDDIDQVTPQKLSELILGVKKS